MIKKCLISPHHIKSKRIYKFSSFRLLFHDSERFIDFYIYDDVVSDELVENKKTEVARNNNNNNHKMFDLCLPSIFFALVKSLHSCGYVGRQSRDFHRKLTIIISLVKFSVIVAWQ